jgi:hypothetical protein
MATKEDIKAKEKEIDQERQRIRKEISDKKDQLQLAKLDEQLKSMKAPLDSGKTKPGTDDTPKVPVPFGAMIAGVLFIGAGVDFLQYKNFLLASIVLIGLGAIFLALGGSKLKMFSKG